MTIDEFRDAGLQSARSDVVLRNQPVAGRVQKFPFGGIEKYGLIFLRRKAGPRGPGHLLLGACREADCGERNKGQGLEDLAPQRRIGRITIFHRLTGAMTACARLRWRTLRPAGRSPAQRTCRPAPPSAPPS